MTKQSDQISTSNKYLIRDIVEKKIIYRSIGNTIISITIKTKIKCAQKFHSKCFNK